MGFLHRLSLIFSTSILFFASMLSAASGTSTTPTLIFSTPEQASIEELTVGDDFLVSLKDLAPYQSVSVSLIDDYGRRIVKIAAKADAQGVVEPVSFWPWTGVVGCDADSESDPAAYRFIDFDQAASYLPGRTFSVDVHGDSEELLVSKALPLVYARKPIFFYSDAAGCPRLTFDRDESIYMTVKNVDLTASHLAIFLVSSLDPTGEDGRILEVRWPYQNQPQVKDQGSGSDWTELLWHYKDSQPGPYHAVLHFFKTVPGVYESPAHSPLIPNRGHPGVTVIPWECRKCDL